MPVSGQFPVSPYVSENSVTTLPTAQLRRDPRLEQSVGAKRKERGRHHVGVLCMQMARSAYQITRRHLD